MKFRYERGKFVEERGWSNIIMMHRDVSLIPVRARCDGLRAWYIWGNSSQRPTILDIHQSRTSSRRANACLTTSSIRERMAS